MGKVSKKVLGTTKGKVGDVAFRKWRGIDVVATYAAENQSKSTKQVQQRELMSAVSNNLKNLLCPIRLGMQYNAKGTTPWAKAVKKNFGILTEGGVFTSDNYQEISISEGGLKVPSLTAAYKDGNNLVVTWAYSDVNPCGKNNPDDQVVIVAALVDANGKFKDQAISTAVNRSTATATLAIPADWDPEVTALAVYGFAYSDDPDVADASDTQYIAVTEPPAPEKHLLTLTSNEAGGATFTVDGEPYTGPVEVEEGAEVTVVATATSGFHWVKWSDNVSSKTRTISMIEDVELVGIVEED